MEHFQTHPDNYMTQEEADGVMAVWAARQRAQADRLSMVTVEDISEATQLSNSEVSAALAEVRSRAKMDSEPDTRHWLVRLQAEPKPSLLAAYLRLAPASGVLALWLSVLVDTPATAVQSEFLRFYGLVVVCLWGTYLLVSATDVLLRRVKGSKQNSQSVR